MERIWLKQYPAGVPADIDVTQYASLVELLEESFAKFSDRKAFICMDKSITYRDLDQMSLAFARLSAEQGPAEGRTRRADDAERAAISGGDRRRAARGLCRGERQSALHPARTRTPAQGFRRRGDHRSGKFRAHGAASASADGGQACHRLQHGGHARSQGHDRQSGGAAGQENGAGVFDSGRGAVQRRRRGRPRHEVQQAEDSARRRRLPAIHRRHHRRLQRRDAASSQHCRQRAAERRLAAAGSGGVPASRPDLHRLRAAALSHLRADGVLPAGGARRRRQSADSQSARHDRLHQGTDEVPGQQLPGGQHALQRTVASSRFQQDRFLQAQDFQRRRHGGADARWPSSGRS